MVRRTPSSKSTRITVSTSFYATLMNRWAGIPVPVPEEHFPPVLIPVNTLDRNLNTQFGIKFGDFTVLI